MKYALLMICLFASSIFAGPSDTIETSKLKLFMKNDEELLEVVDKVFSGSDSSEVFDKVKNGSLSVAILNDYNFSDRNSLDISKVNDDIGKTHGMQITFVKNIGNLNLEGEYLLTIAYKSILHTNSNKPSDFKNDYRDVVYLGAEGYYLADVYFKEENLLELILSKAKQKNAYFYSAGIGFQEINADDLDRGIFLSSRAQQDWHHGNINKGSSSPSIREYNYLANPNASQMGLHIKAEFGKDISLLESENSRTFIRASVEGQYGLIEDLNYIGGKVGLFHDHEFSVLPNIRVMAGIDARKYSQVTYVSSFMEMTLLTEHLDFSLRYEIPHTQEYINALPASFDGRALDINQPKEEGLLWLEMKGKF